MSTLERLQALLAREFDLPAAKLQPGATLEELEIDSLRLIEIVFCIEEELGVRVSAGQDELRARIATLGDLADYLDELAAGRAAP